MVNLEKNLFEISYQYDLTSGNVTQVAYQPGKIDQFYHRYTYDADNRLLEVSTSPDGIIWSVDGLKAPPFKLQ